MRIGGENSRREAGGGEQAARALRGGQQTGAHLGGYFGGEIGGAHPAGVGLAQALADERSSKAPVSRAWPKNRSTADHKSAMPSPVAAEQARTGGCHAPSGGER